MDPVTNPQPESPIPPPVSELQTPPPTPHSFLSKKIIIVFVVIVVLLFASAGTFAVLNSKKTIQQTSTPMVQASPSPTPDPAADWKIYTNTVLNISFKYPQEWYVTDEPSENEQYQFVRVQNYNPIGAPARGYDPAQDKGKYAVVMAKFTKNASSITELQKMLEVSDKEAEPNLGKRFISNEKIMTINGYNALYREVALDRPTNPRTPEVYILNGKGTVIQISPLLGVEDGKTSFDQILSTFKFTQ